MDQERIEMLKEKSFILEENIINNIEEYEHYVLSKKANITCICTENNLLEEFCELVEKTNEKYYINSFFMNDNIEEIKKKATYSDAIIIYTTALKILPQRLYEICEFISNYKKACYVILGGWSCIPKTEELIVKKIKQVSKELTFNNIIMVDAVYNSSINKNLILINTIYKKYIENIISNLAEYRYIQEEILYKKLKDIINKNIKIKKNEIIKEKNTITKLIDFVYKKQIGYEIIFKNINVNIKDISKELIDEITYEKLNDYEKYLENTNVKINLKLVDKIEKEVKENINKKITAYFKKYKNLPSINIKTRTENLKNECLEEMNFLLTQLVKLKYIKEKDINNIKEIIKDVRPINIIIEKQEKKIEEDIEKIIRNLNIEINSIKINLNKFICLNGINQISNFKNNTNKEKNKQDYNKSSEKIISNLSLKVQDIQKSEVISIVKELVKDSQIIIMNNANKIPELSKKELKEISKYYINQYFGKIIIYIDEIETDLTRQITMLEGV